MANDIRPFNSFMDFALGFNSATGEIRGQAVTRTPASPVPNADGQTVLFHVHSVTEISDVKKSLGVSVEAQAAFLGGGGSAAFDFAESSSLHSFSSYLLVSSFVTNASTHMLNEELLPSAKELVAAGRPDRFLQEFGDLYVKGIETGGEFFALVEVQTSDSTDQTNVAASLSVVAFAGGGAESMKAHFSSDSMKSLSTHHLDIASLQISGKGRSAKQFLSAEEMLAAASDFATTVNDHPVSYRVELQDYQSLNLPPPPNAADIQNAKDVLADCAARRDSLLQFRNDIAFILKNPEQFETPSTDLSVLESVTTTALNQIKAAASKCLNDIQTCQFISPPEPDRSKLPKRISHPPSPPPQITIIVPGFVGASLNDVQNSQRQATLPPEQDSDDGHLDEAMVLFFRKGKVNLIFLPPGIENTNPNDFTQVITQQPAAGIGMDSFGALTLQFGPVTPSP
jgi:hypothetical protein